MCNTKVREICYKKFVPKLHVSCLRVQNLLLWRSFFTSYRVSYCAVHPARNLNQCVTMMSTHQRAPSILSPPQVRKMRTTTLCRTRVTGVNRVGRVMLSTRRSILYDGDFPLFYTLVAFSTITTIYSVKRLLVWDVMIRFQGQKRNIYSCCC